MATNAPLQKKLKASTGAATYKTKFNPSWQAEFPFVSRSDSIYSFHCNVCRKDVSCSHQGVNDLKRHEKSLAHQNCISATKSNSRLETMGFVPHGGSLDSQVYIDLSYLASYNVYNTHIFSSDKTSRGKNGNGPCPP